MTVTGRPWDELEDTLTVSRVEALLSDWRDHPPVGDLVASYLGYKPPVKESAAAFNPEDPSGIGGLIQAYPSGLVPINHLGG